MRRLCSALGVAPSGYYAWRARPVSQREMANQVLIGQIEAVFQQSHQTYGSPRVHAELMKQEIPCNEKRVARLMRLQGLQARRVRRRRTTTDSQHTQPVAPNVLNQDFHATAPNQKWVTDITYVPTAQGWLYLAAVMDLFSRRIVGWAMDATITTQLTLQALRMALLTRQPPVGLVHHSDRGSQYASQEYRTLLDRRHIQASMSRTGNCYDNAAMESFFATLKTELVHHHQYLTRSEAKSSIFAYIEGFYNRRRRHSAIGYQSPLEYERTVT